MPIAELQLTETDQDGHHAVAVRGELDIQTAPDLTARLHAHRGKVVVLDLQELRFCDSCGLRALMCERREAQIAGGRLTIVLPDEGPVRRLFEITGLTPD
jgi:anti-anti-sigma factor